MKKIKQIKIIYIFQIIFALLILIALIRGDIIFKFGNGPSKKQQQGNIIKNLDNLEIITGDLYISPLDAWGPFFSSFSTTKDYIALQTYDFTNKELRDFLFNLLDSGVDIKIIQENSKFQQYINTFREMQNLYSGYQNFQIQSDQPMKTEYVHSKINLFDDVFWIQTANLTYSSFHKNREHFFTSSDTGVLSSLKKIFKKDWEGIPIELSDIHPNLVVCNINCRSIIEHLLTNAKKSIGIQTQYITDPNIFNILKKNSDLDLKVLLADTDTNNDVLKYFGPSIARYLPKPYNHTKMILIDDEILLLGSMNMSQNSLDNNREVGILIKDIKVIDKFLDQFQKDWKNGKGRW